MPEQEHRTSYLIRRGVITYSFALALIAAFSITFHFITDSIVHRQEATAQVVNLSGRQRMLSQRIAKLVLERGTHSSVRPDVETQAVLRDDIELMQSSHDELIRGSKVTGGSVLASPMVADVYLRDPWQLDASMREFLRHAHAVANRSSDHISLDDPDLKDVELQAQVNLLNALNAAVDAIARSSEAEIAHLRRVLAVLTLLMLTILVLEAMFLFRPLFKQLAAANAELILTGRTDSLTGCLNRRGFSDEAQRAVLETRRSGTVLSVMMIDIDHFKLINDAYGHAAGDLVISTVSLLIASKTRKGNHLCRMGGEEFSVILHGSTLEQAAIAAEHLRGAVEAHRIHIGNNAGGPVLATTVSIGVALLQASDTTLFQALNRADKALYQAKRNGRNRVELEGAGLHEDSAEQLLHSRA